jgi:hypothetical protein
MMMVKITKEPSTERRLIRTIAGAARPLDEDLGLSRLEMIDRLQKLQSKFADYWIGTSPWLVLDGYALANGPVDRMLKRMDEYGDAVGMVGIAFLPHSQKIGVLKMLFRSKDNARARQLIEKAAEEAVRRLPGLIRQIDPLKGETK